MLSFNELMYIQTALFADFLQGRVCVIIWSFIQGAEFFHCITSLPLSQSVCLSRSVRMCSCAHSEYNLDLFLKIK